MNSKMKDEELRKFMENLLLLPFGFLRPQDRVECCDLEAAPNQVFLGKYLLCQTISTASPSATKDEGLQLTVTDPKGVAVMRLDLYSYSSIDNSMLGLDFDEIVPPGSFVVLKNPWLTSMEGGTGRLLSFNPADVELISRKRLEAIFPDLVWNGQIENKTIQLTQSRDFWSDVKDDDTAAFGKLKGLGNKGFVDKRFADAIRFYDMALDYCNENREDEATIHSNKSAALLALGCFNTALNYAELALEFNPGNEKYNYRKTKALIGLRKYGEALSFLGGKFDQFPSLSKNKDCKTLLDIVKFLSSREKLGPTESQLHSIRSNTLENDAEIPEFTGPLAISKIEGKGRGLVATQDIKTGQLLICAKAFGYQITPQSSNHGIVEEHSGQQIIGKIINKLAFDPELKPELYNLTAGAGFGHLGPGDTKVGYVDMERIKGILKINAFRSRDKNLKNGEATELLGLWILPSFFNHSCSEFNCIWDINGEWMMVTAIAEIKKGEELTISCTSPRDSYEDRLSTFNALGFTCDCSLCQLDASEPISISNERAKILKSLDELSSDCGAEEIKRALKGVEKLVSLRKNNVPLNFPLLSPQMFKLTEILVDKLRVGDSISVLNRMNEVAAASVYWYSFGKDLAFYLLVGHIYIGDKEMVKIWKDNLKAVAIKFYGSLEFSGLPLVALKEKFGIDLYE